MNSTAIEVSSDSSSFAEEWQRIAAHFEHALAVIVQLDNDRARRRLFLTLASAERHADKARDSGHEAEVILVALQPVAGMGGAR